MFNKGRQSRDRLAIRGDGDEKPDTRYVGCFAFIWFGGSGRQSVQAKPASLGGRPRLRNDGSMP